jgi:hypothetical protein
LTNLTNHFDKFCATFVVGDENCPKRLGNFCPCSKVSACVGSVGWTLTLRKPSGSK